MHTSKSRWIGRVAAVAIAATALATAAGCGGDSDDEASGASADGKGSFKGQTLVISTWGGVWTDALKKYFAEPFEKETGAKVQFLVNGFGPDVPAMLQAQQGNVKIDITEGINTEVLRQKGYLAEFPPALMKEFDAKFRPGTYERYGFIFFGASTAIVCNPEIIEKCPRTPEEFWDVDNFPGPRAIANDPNNVMASALLADGVPPDELFPMDIERAMSKLDEIKPHVNVWPSSGDQQRQVIADGEVGTALMWNGQAYSVKKEKVHDLQISFEGATQQLGGWMVMKEAPHLDLAYAFLRWIADHPEAQAKWTAELTYEMPAKGLGELVPKSLRAVLPSEHNPVRLDAAWIAGHQKELKQSWQEFLAG